MSASWTKPSDCATRAYAAREPGGDSALAARKSSPGEPRVATNSNRSPCHLPSAPKAASQRRSARSSIASNTGARSPGDALMIPSTSVVAVRRSNASSRSAVRSSSWPRRSAMISFGSANLMSGARLIRDPYRLFRPYCDRRGPPQASASRRRHDQSGSQRSPGSGNRTVMP